MKKTWPKYTENKTKTKVAVSETKLKAFEEAFDKLDSKEVEKDIYRMTKRRQAKSNEIGVI